MAAEISVHDNFILSYTVDCQKEEISFHTAFYDTEPYEYTDVIFSKVVGHHFEGDNFKTILFGIDQVPPEEVYSTYRNLFERLKSWAWPAITYSTEEDLIERLRNKGIKGFLLSSSYGMTGFVLAEGVQMTPSLR